MRLRISGQAAATGPCLFVLHNESSLKPAHFLTHLPSHCAGIHFFHEGITHSQPPWPNHDCFRLNAHTPNRWQALLTFLHDGGHALCNAHAQQPAPEGFERLPPELVALAAQLPCPIQPLALFEEGRRGLVLHFGEPVQLQGDIESRHLALLDRLRLTRLEGALETGPTTLFQAARHALMRYPQRRLSDSTGVALNGPTLLRNSHILATIMAQHIPPHRCVGVMLPSSIASMATLLALSATGRVPALLNFTAGPRGILAACRSAGIRPIITARAFVQKAGLQEIITSLQQHNQVLFLEDLKAQLSHRQSLRGLLSYTLADRLGGLHLLHSNQRSAQASDPAMILFTSGSEGHAKGVVLSHHNLLANVRQIALSVPLHHHDRYLNTLPMFHAFGLTVGTLTPLLQGLHLHHHPSPLAQQAICHLGRSYRPTILAGTDTFLANYARSAKVGDFSSVRFVFAGAEPLRAATTELWQQRFGVNVYQGYGATECAPVIAVNTPAANRPHTVGRPVAGIRCRLQPVPGLAHGGRLLVAGPNIMQGYLAPQDSAPDQGGLPIQALAEPPWYDTGDIVTLDEQGYISIDGRAKRFAKIGGEMVSLAAVERLASRVWPQQQHAALRLPSPNKGEWILLFSETPGCSRERLLEQADQEGSTRLLVPRRVVHVDTLPLLGNGKLDHAALAQLAATLET
ncbi:AMP-binding protein [Magnetococcus marinus]|nr:AMP-binding protein [Magnetococcus marinus]